MASQLLFYDRRKSSAQLQIDDRRNGERRKHFQECLPERRRLASQVRRYEREAFKIPVHLELGDKREATGHTHDIGPEGLMMFSETALAPGTPVSLHFSFDENVCYLNISGQVVFSRLIEKNSTLLIAIGMKFSGMREFEKNIISSSVKYLNTNYFRDRSLLTIRVSCDSLAIKVTDSCKPEPTNFYTESYNNGNRRLEVPTVTRPDVTPKKRQRDYTLEAAQRRREWLGSKIGAELRHIGVLSEDPQRMQGNIENLLGVTHVPLGIAGPLKVNGRYANSVYYIPMATTEGALVYTYSKGMRLVSLAGGVNVHLLRDEIHISPIFIFQNTSRAKEFSDWLSDNFERIKKEAEKTTRYGKLIRLEPHLLDHGVVVKFCYTTGDAMGLNMINIATEEACKLVNSEVKPEEFYLRSNFSSVKKVSAHNYAVGGFGKTIIADVTIPGSLLKRFFRVSPEAMARYYHLALLSSVHAGMVGMNGHIANGLSAIFTACGQDIANVVDSQVSIINVEPTKGGDLYVSIKIPNLVLGTVGGGVSLGPQRECLEILGCYGAGKVGKFAEIVAASVLAGEIGVAAAVISGTFVEAHKKYGRKPAGATWGERM